MLEKKENFRIMILSLLTLLIGLFLGSYFQFNTKFDPWLNHSGELFKNIFTILGGALLVISIIRNFFIKK